MITDSAYFWFRLFRTRGIGPKGLVSIYRALSDAQLSPDKMPLNKRILYEEYPKLAKLLASKIKPEDQASTHKEYAELQEKEVTLVYPGHEHYPKMLLSSSELLNIPPVLFCRGNTSLLKADSIAIVGSRNVTSKGAIATRYLASELALRGFNIVSGYAKGVDTEAHLGALEAEGTTSMILSYGILEFKLKREFDAFDKRNIVAVSQFGLHERWRARNAMSRNKLVCALANGVVVIESGPERDNQGRMSGTFNAAKIVLDLGLPLFVLSPDTFDAPPLGNAELLKLGGIEITIEEGAEVISQTLTHKPLPVKEAPVQTNLFDTTTGT